ncbi:hypothetical protein GNI_123970 [Gregarina niphandrodes]|uniref:Inner membrane complex protein n=1 Tax=Gregarina niphandrodes TaxID=110365 RepID=A0A023B280_GRENI|nr:hypothetical protein GNI_123970 [Gregarina niphandrodes]EZG51584.1 hypothetical protein GNI_123970 [Gregarina niphandrodes]|eukprot:XP_011131944.1 hypothetical protein GNI_123970 [Gregarina niphandrodes]
MKLDHPKWQGPGEVVCELTYLGEKMVMNEYIVEREVVQPVKTTTEHLFETKNQTPVVCTCSTYVIPTRRLVEEIVQVPQTVREHIVQVEKPVIYETVIEVPEFEYREKIVDFPVVLQRPRPVSVKYNPLGTASQQRLVEQIRAGMAQPPTSSPHLPVRHVSTRQLPERQLPSKHVIRHVTVDSPISSQWGDPVPMPVCQHCPQVIYSETVEHDLIQSPEWDQSDVSRLDVVQPELVEPELIQPELVQVDFADVGHHDVDPLNVGPLEEVPPAEVVIVEPPQVIYHPEKFSYAPAIASPWRQVSFDFGPDLSEPASEFTTLIPYGEKPATGGLGGSPYDYCTQSTAYSTTPGVGTVSTWHEERLPPSWRGSSEGQLDHLVSDHLVSDRLVSDQLVSDHLGSEQIGSERLSSYIVGDGDDPRQCCFPPSAGVMGLLDEGDLISREASEYNITVERADGDDGLLIESERDDSEPNEDPQSSPARDFFVGAAAQPVRRFYCKPCNPGVDAYSPEENAYNPEVDAYGPEANAYSPEVNPHTTGHTSVHTTVYSTHGPTTVDCPPGPGAQFYSAETEVRIPVPVVADTTVEFKVPRISTKYSKRDVPLYVPRFIETNVEAELYCDSTLLEDAANCDKGLLDAIERNEAALKTLRRTGDGAARKAFVEGPASGGGLIPGEGTAEEGTAERWTADEQTADGGLGGSSASRPLTKRNPTTGEQRAGGSEGSVADKYAPVTLSELHDAAEYIKSLDFERRLMEQKAAENLLYYWQTNQLLINEVSVASVCAGVSGDGTPFLETVAVVTRNEPPTELTSDPRSSDCSSLDAHGHEH